MNTTRRVPVRYLVLLRDWLQSLGVDTTALLRMASIAKAKFDQHDATLEPMEMEAFIASARQLTGRGDLGFELGRLIKVTSHDLLGYGMLSCRNIDEAMRLVMRHYHLITETFTFRYQREPAGTGEVVYAPTIAMPLETLRFYLETLAVTHDNQLRLMMGGGGGYDIFISMPPPPHIARYRALAPTRFHFDEVALPRVRVVMGADVLDHALPFADARQMMEIDRRCETLGQRPRNTGQDWVEYLRMMLRQSDGQVPTLESIAQNNGVSPRTIDRYLRRENLSFRELLQQVRFERACELLLSSDMTVSQIALRLGFSDCANFGRAFRRATGATPSEYRQRAREQDALPLLAEALSLANIGGIPKLPEDTHPLAVRMAKELRKATTPRAPVAPHLPIVVNPDTTASPALTSHGHGLLTAKEVDVLHLLAQGLPNKLIASHMNVSDETVKWHLKNIFGKLSAGNRRHAIDRARLLGLVQY